MLLQHSYVLKEFNLQPNNKTILYYITPIIIIRFPYSHYFDPFSNFLWSRRFGSQTSEVWAQTIRTSFFRPGVEINIIYLTLKDINKKNDIKSSTVAAAEIRKEKPWCMQSSVTAGTVSASYNLSRRQVRFKDPSSRFRIVSQWIQDCFTLVREFARVLIMSSTTWLSCAAIDSEDRGWTTTEQKKQNKKKNEISLDMDNGSRTLKPQLLKGNVQFEISLRMTVGSMVETLWW